MASWMCPETAHFASDHMAMQTRKRPPVHTLCDYISLLVMERRSVMVSRVSARLISCALVPLCPCAHVPMCSTLLPSLTYTKAPCTSAGGLFVSQCIAHTPRMTTSGTGSHNGISSSMMPAELSGRTIHRWLMPQPCWPTTASLLGEQTTSPSPGEPIYTLTSLVVFLLLCCKCFIPFIHTT